MIVTINNESGTTTYGIIFPLASTSSDPSQIVGDFAQLKISKFIVLFLFLL